jgi:hypothetical protein
MKQITAERMKKIAESREEKLRVEQVKELLRIYRHEWFRDLDRRLESLFMPQNWEKLRLKADTSLNLLRWTTDQIGAIYSEPARREIEGGSSETLEYYEQGGKLDFQLDAAARLCFLCRALFLRPLVHNEKRWTLDIVTPDQVTVIPSEKEPGAISAIVVHLPAPFGEERDKDEKAHVLWTTEEYQELDSSWSPLSDPKPNPYKRIPYMPVHAAFPSIGFWQQQDSFGLREATYRAGIAMTDHAHLRHVQSFKQLVISGTPADQNWSSLIADPSAAIHLKGQGTASVVDMQADLNGHLEGILTQAASVLNLYGIRPEAVRGTMDASSGYALSLKNRSLHRAWGQLRRVWTFAEEELFSLLGTVARVDLGKDMCEGKLYIEHADLNAEADPSTQANTLATLVNAGIISKEEARRRLDIEDEERAKISNEIMVEQATADPLKGLM